MFSHIKPFFHIFILIYISIFFVPLNAFSAEDEWITPEVKAPRLSQYFFYSKVVNKKISFHAYLPKSYHQQKDRHYPVIYWLHGTGGGIMELPKLIEHFDAAMEARHLAEAIVIVPNGLRDSMWSDSKDGKVPMETVLMQELLPDAESRFRIIKSRNGRIIEGFSMGGYGAARLGLKYPETFGAVSILGAGPMQPELDADQGPTDKRADRIKVFREVYGDDQAYFVSLSPWKIAQQQVDLVRGRLLIRIAVGERDTTRKPSEDFSRLLGNMDVQHQFFVAPKVGHNPIQIFNAMGNSNWQFYRNAWRQTGITSGELHQESPPPAIKRYSPAIERLKAFDRDGDGDILIQDIPPRARALFRRLDTDGDGVLRTDEQAR